VAALESERGVNVKTASFARETGLLDWDGFEQLITKRTKVIAIGAARTR